MAKKISVIYIAFVLLFMVCVTFGITRNERSEKGCARLNKNYCKCLKPSEFKDDECGLHERVMSKNQKRRCENIQKKLENICDFDDSSSTPSKSQFINTTP